jgi:hypothetical protein
LPNEPRPIITASQPVSSSMRTASRALITSPFPATGIETARLASRITDQSARPSNFCARVRAWIATRATPHCSRSCATSTPLRWSLSQPQRVFAVTGSDEAPTTARTISSRRGRLHRSAAPASRVTTLCTGQPMLRSRKSGRSSGGRDET